MSKMALIHRCAGLRPGRVTTPLAATKHSLRSLARLWQELAGEIKEHERLLTDLTSALAPQLVDAFGVGPDTAAELLIVAGDNDRVRSEPAWARLCGVAPIPAAARCESVNERRRLLCRSALMRPTSESENEP